MQVEAISAKEKIDRLKKKGDWLLELETHSVAITVVQADGKNQESYYVLVKNKGWMHVDALEENDEIIVSYSLEDEIALQKYIQTFLKLDNENRVNKITPGIRDSKNWVHYLALHNCLHDKRVSANIDSKTITAVHEEMKKLLKGDDFDAMRLTENSYYYPLMRAVEIEIQEIIRSFSQEEIILNRQFVNKINQSWGREPLASVTPTGKLEENLKVPPQIDSEIIMGEKENQEDRIAAIKVNIHPSWENRIPELLACVVKCLSVLVYSKVERYDEAGTTFVLVLPHGNKVYTANIGDSYAIAWSRDPKTQKVTARYLNWPHQITNIVTKDHNDFEKKRIEKANGILKMDDNGHYRLGGHLLPTRNMGNKSSEKTSDFGKEVFRNAGNTDTPSIMVEGNISEGYIVASDGIEILTLSEIEEIIEEAESEGSDIAQKIADAAYEQGSRDDISVVCLKKGVDVVLAEADGHGPKNEKIGHKLSECAMFFLDQLLRNIAEADATDVISNIETCLRLNYNEKLVCSQNKFFYSSDFSGMQKIPEIPAPMFSNNNNDNNSVSSAQKSGLKRTYDAMHQGGMFSQKDMQHLSINSILNNETESLNLNPEQDDTKINVSNNISWLNKPS